MKIEFIRRLLRLSRAIKEAIIQNDVNGDLIPALFSVYSYIYLKGTKNLINKNKWYEKD